MLALCQEVASEQISDDTTFRNLETTLSAEAVNRLHFQTTAWVYDTTAQIFRRSIATIHFANQLLQFGLIFHHHDAKKTPISTPSHEAID